VSGAGPDDKFVFLCAFFSHSHLALHVTLPFDVQQTPVTPTNNPRMMSLRMKKMVWTKVRLLYFSPQDTLRYRFYVVIITCDEQRIIDNVTTCRFPPERSTVPDSLF
jgi:hypothetical protein